MSDSLDLKRLSLDIVDILMTVLPNDAEVWQCCCQPFSMRWPQWVMKPKMRLGAVLLSTILNEMVAVGHETEMRLGAVLLWTIRNEMVAVGHETEMRYGAVFTWNHS